MGKLESRCSFRTWQMQLSPTAMLCHLPEESSEFDFDSVKPRKEANAPARSFSSAYQGNGFFVISLRQR